MTPSTLAETILRDVKRYSLNMLAIEMYETPHGGWVKLPAVEAALSRAIDPAIAERAGEVLERLQKADEYEPLGHDGWDAADLITALLAQNAALQAQAREMAMDVLEASGQAQEAYQAQLAAEEKLADWLSERDALRTERDDAIAKRAAFELGAKISAEAERVAKWERDRAEAAEAREERLRGALERIKADDQHQSEWRYWEKEDGYFAKIARAALTETATTEEGK